MRCDAGSGVVRMNKPFLTELLKACSGRTTVRFMRGTGRMIVADAPGYLEVSIHIDSYLAQIMWRVWELRLVS